MKLRLRHLIAAAVVAAGVQSMSAQVTSTEFRITNGTNRISMTGSPSTTNTTYRFAAPTGVGAVLGTSWASSTLDVTVGRLPLNDSNYVTGILNVNNGGTGTTSIPANQILLGNSTGTGIVGAGAMTNGQILIGQTGGTPVAATLTAGSGIQITNAAGAITIAASGSLTGQTASVATTPGTQNYTVTAPFDLLAGGRVIVTVHDPSEDGIFATVTGVNVTTDVATIHLSSPPLTAGRIDVFFQNP